MSKDCCKKCQERLTIKNKIIDKLIMSNGNIRHIIKNASSFSIDYFKIITQLKLVSDEVLELADEENKLMLQTFLNEGKLQ